jgi:hypothetical protein
VQVQVCHPLLPIDQELQPVLAHGGQVGTACHEAHIRAGSRQLDAEIAADRAGAVNADLHDVLLGHGGAIAPVVGSLVTPWN